jgi:hypothetical protein
MQFESFSFSLNKPNNCLSGKFDDRNTGSAPSKKRSSIAAEVEDVVTRSAPARADHFFEATAADVIQGQARQIRSSPVHMQEIASPCTPKVTLSAAAFPCMSTPGSPFMPAHGSPCTSESSWPNMHGHAYSASANALPRTPASVSRDTALLIQKQILFRKLRRVLFRWILLAILKQLGSPWSVVQRLVLVNFKKKKKG